VPVCPTCGEDNPARARFCLNCAAPLATPTPAREQRKTVTVLFCDVTGSTELGERRDPETVRVLLANYFDRMKTIVERHGGTVEKFIGDAVMAVFGVPVVHEDDALRAARAAIEMRDVFPELGVEGCIGVTTGEVVTGTEERLATGDAVNVAARLQQAAEPGAVLIGEPTFRLIRDAVEADELDPLVVKGKSEPVPAFRLRAVVGDAGFARRQDVPMVGREREQRLLAAAWERVVTEGSCQLFTILGAAGVGKSRLAAEFLSSLTNALVVRGRCLSYGEGITYWPVVEVVKQLPPTSTDPAATRTIRALVGDEQLVTSSEEIAWAFRAHLEAVAEMRPVVCVFDDLHWGEATFLDLIEHVADLSRDAPILLLCMARPELLDRREGWAGGKVNATNVLLEPLGPDETAQLIDSLAELDDGLRDRIREAAEGNPLYMEEMVALARESGDGEVSVPPTIQALLAARLDQLGLAERGVLERGAVEGRVFHRGAVEALAPEQPPVASSLTALVRKELVRPDRAQLPGENAFRFRHLLIRDAAYDALPKAERAVLHERFAYWLEEHGTTLVELDEVLGHHLEQAYRYGVELGSPNDALALRASERLATAGQRAFVRGDSPGAVVLLTRARAILPAGTRDVMLEIDLSRALFFGGRVADAEALLREAIATATERGDERAALIARLRLSQVTMHADPEGREAEAFELATSAIPIFEATDDDQGLTEGWTVIAYVEHNRCHWAARKEALERAIHHAERSGAEQRAKQLERLLGPSYEFGPIPVEEAVRWFEAEAAVRGREPFYLAGMAHLEAMRGHIEEARVLVAEAVDRSEALGSSVTAALVGATRSDVEMRAGNPAGAEAALRRSCALLEQVGERGWLSSMAAELGLVLCDLGRHDEAEAWAARSRELGASDDVLTQMYCRQVDARIDAHRGNLDDAERLAREAVAMGEPTDMLVDRAGTHVDLAEVLVLAGRREEAAAEIQKALVLFEQKGDRVRVEATLARRAQLA